MKEHDEQRFSRRGALKSAGIAAISSAIGGVVGACQRSQPAIAGETGKPLELPRLLAASEKESSEASAPLAPENRVGVALVGLGRLALEQVMPAFAESKLCRPIALVSGDRGKAGTVARRYGLPERNIFDYKSWNRLADNKDVQIVYILLPNGMHAEYSIRAAQAGKHVLCEKPMATSVEDCQAMIDASDKARKLLMVAYRLQYEPYNREVIRSARSGELGKLKSFIASNGQAQGDPNQWRLKKSLAGGGALPDVGIYCLNAARYISGEEPNAVSAFVHSTPNDARFREVEEQVNFTLRFPSGFLASSTTSYGYHDAKFFRVLGSSGWAELDPAFPYRGQRLRVGRKLEGRDAEQIEERKLEPKNHFALEMDHLASCVLGNKRPRTPGQEGLQDMRVIAAIYRAAESGGTVKLPEITELDAFRGPALG
jgi:predicted dehydrogenase